MSFIVPAILPASREDIERKVASLVGQVDVVQIDVVDGKFTQPASWPYTTAQEDAGAMYSAEDPLPYLGQIHYEVDMMITEPENVVGEWIAAGVDRLVFHAESSRFVLKTMEEVSVHYGRDKDFTPDLLSLGVAINIESDVALLDPFLQFADYVQFMGISSIGKQGQPFDERVLRKISQFRSRHSDVLIQVDGGVNLESAHALLSIGVDRLVIGSALWKSGDIKNTLELFNGIVREYNG